MPSKRTMALLVASTPVLVAIVMVAMAFYRGDTFLIWLAALLTAIGVASALVYEKYAR